MPSLNDTLKNVDLLHDLNQKQDWAKLKHPPITPKAFKVVVFKPRIPTMTENIRCPLFVALNHE